MVSGKDFQRAYRQGSRARASKVLVVVCGNGLGHSRLGLSVGKRIWRQAVHRNRIRRLFREAFRLDYDELPQGLDIVLIPAEARLVATLAEVRAELVPLAAKAHRRWLERQAQERAKAESAAPAPAASSALSQPEGPRP